MPQAAAAAFSSWVGTYAASIGASAALTATITTAAYWTAYAVTTLAITVGLSKVSSALMGKPKDGAGVQTRRSVVRDSVQPRTIVYGEVRTGGTLVYINTGGDRNEFLDFVIEVAGHEVSAITDVWFDDDKITNANISGGAAAGGVVTGGKYAGIAWIFKYLGTDSQTASSTLMASYPVEWTSNHRGRGVAYVHIRLRRDKDVFYQGPPGNFNFTVRGAKVYDPRLDSTNGGSGSHRVTDPSTWAYSNNPALCAADYVIGGTVCNIATRDNRRGFGASPGDVDWASIITGANICDENVTIPPASPATTQKRYACDGVLSTGEYPAENIEQLLTCCMGQITPPGAKYRLFVGAYASPSTTLTEADLAGSIEYVKDTPRADRYNAVTGTRWDSESGQESEFLPRTSPSYEAEDGARLDRSIALPFTVNEYRAQRIAQVILRRSRDQATIVWRGKLGCLRVGVWETVAVTVAELGLSAKVFRCISREFRPGAEGDAVVELTLREDNSSTYTDPIVADYDDVTPVTPDPAPDDYVDTAGDLSVVFDPELTYTTDSANLQYWTKVGTIACDGTTATLTADGVTDAAIRTKHLRAFPVTVTSAWTLAVSIRYRVKTALTGPNKRLLVNCYASNEADDARTLADTYSIDLAGATLSAWYIVQANLAYAPDTGKDRVRLEALIDKDEVTGGEVEIDYLYGYRLAIVVDPGAAVQPVTGYLTNEAVTLAADAGGTVASFATAMGQFKVFQGVTDVTSSATFAEVSETSCTGEINTADNTPVGGQTRGYYRVTALSADSGLYTVSATYAGVTITKSLSLAKARQSTATAPPELRLSRPSANVFFYYSGDALSYADLVGTCSVWSGGVDVTASATLTAVATGCTGNVNGSYGSPYAGQPKGYYAVTAVAAYESSLTITATYGGQTTAQTFQVSRVDIGIETVAGLPGTNLFDGRIVYIGGKLWRYVGVPGSGGYWTAAVPAADITGQIISTQITDGAISTPKLAAGAVVAGTIAAGAVTTDALLAGSVTTAKIATGSITAASGILADAVITTAKISSLAVVNAHIQDLAVDTIKVANSAITVSAVDDSDLGAGSVPTVGTAWTAVPGATVTVSGVPASNARIVIHAAANLRSYNASAQNFAVGLRRDADSVVFYGATVRLQGGAVWTVPNWPFVDSTPLSGTQSYTLVIRWISGNTNIGQWQEVRLVATVLKK
jgi:hypothetical protein